MKAKKSYCAKCEKAVRVIIEDLISANELKQFNEEVEQMKLQVKYIPVEEYNLQLFCNVECSVKNNRCLPVRLVDSANGGY